jgi:flagellar assembly protein FliH
MRKWAAEFEGAQAAGTSRSSSRIISAERLANYVPFAMAELGRERRPSPLDRPAAERRPARARNAGEVPLAFRPLGENLEPASSDGGDYDNGYKAGLAAGLAEGRQRGFEAGVASAAESLRQADEQAGATLSTRIEALCGALGARFAEIERDAADEVIALALEVASQVLRSTLSVRPEAILPVVQEALAGLFDDRMRMRLHLHPADAELVRNSLAERLEGGTCEIVVNPLIQAGGCRIETPRAEIDATLETRWRRTLAAIGRASDGALAQAAEPSA